MTLLRIKCFIFYRELCEYFFFQIGQVNNIQIIYFLFNRILMKKKMQHEILHIHSSMNIIR